MRCVVDTNVLVSFALREGSVPWQAVVAVLRGGALLSCDVHLAEVQRVLLLPKFDRYAPREQRQRVLDRLVPHFVSVHLTDEIRACRDPKDNVFLELAVNGSATHVITGDADLLVLNPFRDIPIPSPAAFLESISDTGR